MDSLEIGFPSSLNQMQNQHRVNSYYQQSQSQSQSHNQNQYQQHHQHLHQQQSQQAPQSFPPHQHMYSSSSSSSSASISSSTMYSSSSANPAPSLISSSSSSYSYSTTITNDSSGSGIGLPVKVNTSQDKPVSLFSNCLTLIEKLYSFPLFEFYLFPDGVEILQLQDSPLIDPISILWSCFRLGAPLCMIYNQISPHAPLNVSDVSSIRPPNYTAICKKDVYNFIVACRDNLQIKEVENFQLSELYKEDTHGFVKVIINFSNKL